jgi:hypothetical protein
LVSERREVFIDEVEKIGFYIVERQGPSTDLNFIKEYTQLPKQKRKNLLLDILEVFNH